MEFKRGGSWRRISRGTGPIGSGPKDAATLTSLEEQGGGIGEGG